MYNGFMKRIVAAIVAVLFVVSFPLLAVDSYMIGLSSDFYDLVDALYSSTGLASASYARPWSRSEAELVLGRLEKRLRTAEEKSLYDVAMSMLDDLDVRWSFEDGFGIGASVSVSPEYYFHTNSEFDNDYLWLYDYDDRRPFLHADLEFSVYELFYTYCDLQYTIGRYYGEDLAFLPAQDVGAILSSTDGPRIVTHARQYSQMHSFNVPFKSADFEFEWPKRAMISLGGDFWLFMFGRDRISWGNSRVGNFIFDDHVGYHDMIRLSFFTDLFKYEFSTLFLDTNSDGSESTADEYGRIYLAHRLEFRPWSWMDLAISENIMYRYDIVEFQFLNPGYIFHNLNNRSMFNAIAYAELNITPLNGWDISMQFVLDQARAPNEGGSQSDAWGLMAGTDFTFLAGGGYVTPNLEFVYTTPLLYRRDKVDFLMYQRSVSYDGGNPAKLYYIGFPYGGDVMLLHLGVDYSIPSVFDLRFSLEGMLKGEMNMLMSHNTDGDNSGDANYRGQTPSGDRIMECMMAELYAEFKAPRILDIIETSVYADVSWIGSVMYDRPERVYDSFRCDFQLAFGFSLSF